MNPDTYPTDRYQEQLSNLSTGEIILQVWHEEGLELTFSGEGFDLHRVPGGNAFEWPEERLLLSSFDTLEEFWLDLTSQANWISRTKGKRKIHPVLSRFILRMHNEFVHQGSFTYDEMLPIHGWVQKVYDRIIFRNRIWQFCPNCGAQVKYYPRYPKYLCNTCQRLPKVSQEGQPMEIIPLNEWEGFRVITQMPDGTKREQKQLHSVPYLLNGQPYAMGFTRFGGVVNAQLEGHRYYLV